jgi:hypothetical protein
VVRVHGLTLIRDEWPLALLAINHALLHHVERLHCAVQISADATLAGVQRLRAHWGDRLTVVEVSTPAYLQEAITSVLAAMVAAEAEASDWLYVFDADEFAVSPAAMPLPRLLEGRPPALAELRYRIWNWIAPHDFDDLDLASYPRLRHRALPCVFLDLPPCQLAAEIQRGFLNFFDLRFVDKSLFRIGALRDRWIGPGAHRLHPVESWELQEPSLATESFHAMHLPLLSRRRLAMRLAQARNLRGEGFPFEHGWQSQMLLEIEARRQLEAFWRAHTIAPTSLAGAPGAPCYEASDLFADTIAPALALTQSLLEGSAAAAPPPPSRLPEDLLLRRIHHLQNQVTQRPLERPQGG